ncbi:MAG: hypothetical protein CMJ84_14990 [Planctomycetes bacterium]|nr:hypothetical protein [Planctomycetota bacterium]
MPFSLAVAGGVLLAGIVSFGVPRAEALVPPLPFDPACQCEPSVSTLTSGACDCDVIMGPITKVGADCTPPPECSVINSNKCTAQVLVSFLGPGSECTGTFSLNVEAHCDGSGSTRKGCPGGEGFVALVLACAEDCTEVE